MDAQPESDCLQSRSDRSLLRRFRSGEQDAATELFLRYARQLRGVAASNQATHLAPRFDPEDVVQSVFRTFFRRAKQGMYEIPPGEELWKLLLVLALYKVRELAVYHRAKKRDVTRTLGSSALHFAESSSHDEEAFRVLRSVVDDKLGSLIASHRKIVVMRIEGHTIQSIADATGYSKRTVERVLTEFRRGLASMVSETS